VAQRFPIFTVSLISVLLASCGGYTEYVADSSGRLHPTAHYSDAWQYIFERDIAAELRGDPPPKFYKQERARTWKEYWQTQYVKLAGMGRQSGSDSWGPKHIAQARALRIKHGLDPY